VSRGPVRRAARAFFARDARVALSYKLPFALEIVSAGFALLTTWFIAKLVDAGQVPGGYFAFVVLGLAVATLVDAAVATVGADVRGEQMLGTLEATLSTGLPTHALAAGMVAFPLVSAAFSAVVYLVLAVLLGVRAPGANWPLALTGVVIAVVAFSGLGFVGAALVLLIRRAAAAVGWLVAVLGFAAGEFFPPHLLPGWMQALAALSPLTWCLRVVRAAVLEGAGWSDAWNELAVLVVMAFAFLALGVVTLSVALRHARRRGTLAGY
jgi:ABC-2 type transport system permease protein